MQADREDTTRGLLAIIIQTRCGGAVERCHTIRHHGTYSNAAHQWGVAMLAKVLFPEHCDRIVWHCLTHDVPEGWVGDIPAPALRGIPGVADSINPIERALNNALGYPGEDEGLTDEEYKALKTCDRLEFLLWCHEQLCMGNVYAREPFNEVSKYLADVPSHVEALIQRIITDCPVPIQAGIVKATVENL